MGLTTNHSEDQVLERCGSAAPNEGGSLSLPVNEHHAAQSAAIHEGNVPLLPADADAEHFYSSHVPYFDYLAATERSRQAQLHAQSCASTTFDPSDFVAMLERNFSRIDANGDGVLSEEELARFAHDPQNDSSDRKNAELALLHTDDLHKIVDAGEQHRMEFFDGLPYTIAGQIGGRVYDELFVSAGHKPGSISLQDVAMMKMLEDPNVFSQKLNQIRKIEKISAAGPFRSAEQQLRNEYEARRKMLAA